jgi:GTP-binding protein
MKITQSIFELGAASATQFPEPDLPEIVFLGRSNVGKSSLLNTITGKKGLAKISSTPGKTQQINFFRINDVMRFVDLPGYGFAKASAQARDKWGKLIMRYLDSDRPIGLVLHLIDSRHSFQELDSQVMKWMVQLEMPIQVIATKFDKLNQKQKAKQGKVLADGVLSTGCGSTIMPFSSVKGTGKVELIRLIFNAAGI